MNKQNYKPDWNNTLSPYLMVDSVEQEISFITEVFGGELVEAPRSPDGKMFHAEIKIDDSVIMIGRSSDDWPSLKGNIHI
jgi:PhnB protein